MSEFLVPALIAIAGTAVLVARLRAYRSQRSDSRRARPFERGELHFAARAKRSSESGSALTSTALPFAGSVMVAIIAVAFVTLAIWIAVNVDHPLAFLLPVFAIAAFAGALWYGLLGARGAARRRTALERLEREGVEVEGRILRSYENIGRITCTVEAEAIVDGRRVTFKDDSLSASLIRTTTDGVSLRPGSTIVIRYLPADVRVFAVVATSAPSTEEVEHEARDLRQGVGFIVLFGIGALIAAWSTGESEFLFAAALGFFFGALIWLKARYIAS